MWLRGGPMLNFFILAYSGGILVYFTACLGAAWAGYDKLKRDCAKDRDLGWVTSDPRPLPIAAKVVLLSLGSAVLWPFSLYQVLK